jgi:hypothetical protein
MFVIGAVSLLGIGVAARLCPISAHAALTACLPPAAHYHPRMDEAGSSPENETSAQTAW